jgi:DeoR/GlpR family transcriptional regulator of sugar metabolism
MSAARLFIRVTQAELAALAGLSRQTVNQVVVQLARQRRLKQAYGGLWLPPEPSSGG